MADFKVQIIKISPLSSSVSANSDPALKIGAETAKTKLLDQFQSLLLDLIEDEVVVKLQIFLTH